MFPIYTVYYSYLPQQFISMIEESFNFDPFEDLRNDSANAAIKLTAFAFSVAQHRRG